jgi:hypothetical protein
VRRAADRVLLALILVIPGAQPHAIRICGADCGSRGLSTTLLDANRGALAKHMVLAINSRPTARAFAATAMPGSFLS